jgi:hypothetical protein
MKASACWLGLLASFCFYFRESVSFSQESLFPFSGLYMTVQLTCWLGWIYSHRRGLCSPEAYGSEICQASNRLSFPGSKPSSYHLYRQRVHGERTNKRMFCHEKPLLLSQTMEKGSKSYRQICLGVYFGTSLIGWNRRCIEFIVEDAGKMVGYNITNMSQGSLMGVKVLLSTASLVTLNERVSLILDGDEFEISVMQMKLDLSPLLTIIKHSMDTSGTQASNEKSCSEYTVSEDFTAASTKAMTRLKS